MPDEKISEFTSGGLVQTTDQLAGVRAGANYRFLTGSAASKDVGTDIDDIPQYTDDGLGNPVLSPDALDTNEANKWNKQQWIPAAVLLSDSSDEIDWDLDDAQCAQHVATGNVTLNNPTNMKDGGVYSFRWVQNDTTPYTLSFDTAFIFFAGAPIVSSDLESVCEFIFKSDGMYMRGIMNSFPS